MKKNITDLEKVLDLLVEGLENKDFGESDLDRLIRRHPEYADDLRKSWKIWRELDDIEVPEINSLSRERFYQTLNDFQQVANERMPGGKYVHINTVLRWAAIFIIGVGVGLFANSGFFRAGNVDKVSGNGKNQILAQLTAGESASNRMAAIQHIKGLTNPEDQVFEALFTTLVNDPNVNVRLSTIEAMLHFVDNPKSRELLIKAITYQDDPIVQITLAEVIIRLQQEGSVDEIRKLLEMNELDLEVKMHLMETMNL